jgi:hypothetical protein
MTFLGVAFNYAEQEGTGVFYENTRDPKFESLNKEMLK